MIYNELGRLGTSGPLASERDLYAVNMANPSPESAKDIEAMQTIMSRVKNGGSFVIMSCDAGFGPNGTALLNELHKLNKKIDIYLNQDYSNIEAVKGQIQIWKGGTGISDKDLKFGWMKQGPSTQGKVQKLKNLPRHTGDIYLDTRSGYKVVNEILRKK